MFTFLNCPAPNSLPLARLLNLGVPRLFPLMNKFQHQLRLLFFFSLSSVECRNSVSSFLHCDFLETETTTLILLFSSYEFPQFWPSTLIFCWCPSNICWHFCLYSAHVPFRVLLNASVVLVFLTPRLHRPDAGSSCLIKLAVEIIHKFSQTYRKNRMGEEVSNKKITVSLSNLVTFQTLLHDQISLTIDLNFNRSLENV